VYIVFTLKIFIMYTYIDQCTYIHTCTSIYMYLKYTLYMYIYIGTYINYVSVGCDVDIFKHS